jgi:hypothetical protein
MEAIGAVFRIVDFMLQLLDLLDFVLSPVRHWESWHETANPVQYLLACLTGLAVLLVVAFWAADRLGFL